MEQYHPHPLQIISNIKRFLYLLLIPLFRGLLSLLRGDFRLWLSGAWKDGVVIGFIILFSVLQWINYTISINEEGVSLRFGVVRKVYKMLPAQSICVVNKKIPLYLYPLGGVRIYCDTPAGGSGRSDLAVIVAPRVWDKISKIIPAREGEQMTKTYCPKNLYVLLLAAVTSNSLTGVLLAATLISKGGQLLGEGFAREIYGTFQLWVKALAFGLPPAAAGLGYILLIGWGLTFFRNFLQHQNFSVTSAGNSLTIGCGLLEKKIWRIRRDKINYLDIRQTLYTKALGLYTVFLYSFGYGKERDEISALMPAVGKRNLDLSLEMLLPEFKMGVLTVRPQPGSLGRFLWQPVFPAICVAIAAFLASQQWSDWAQLWQWLGIMGEIPLLWFAAVRLTDWRTSGGGWKDRLLTIRYSRGFSFHTVVIPRDKIAMMKTTQSIFQMWKKNCDLLVYSYSEGRQVHRLRNISMVDAQRLILSANNHENKK